MCKRRDPVDRIGHKTLPNLEIIFPNVYFEVSAFVDTKVQDTKHVNTQGCNASLCMMTAVREKP